MYASVKQGKLVASQKIQRVRKTSKQKILKGNNVISYIWSKLLEFAASYTKTRAELKTRIHQASNHVINIFLIFWTNYDGLLTILICGIHRLICAIHISSEWNRLSMSIIFSLVSSLGFNCCSSSTTFSLIKDSVHRRLWDCHNKGEKE